MDISKKAFAIYIIATVLLSVMASAVCYNSLLLHPTHKTPKATANVFILVETAHGSCELPAGNVITNIGERLPRNILGFNNVTGHNATKWISVSNDASPSATWTKLPNEVNANGFTRALGTVVAWMNGTDYAYNVTLKFTATATQQIQCAGAQWNDTPGSDNNLYACAAFDQTTFGANDNCTIKWVFTYDFN